MAELGSAYVVVRAITDGVERDIQKGFSNVNRIGERAGADTAKSFGRGFNGGGGSFWATKLARDAENARLVLRRLTIANLFLTPAIQGVVGAIGALGGGLVILSTIVSRASQGLVVLGSSLSALIQTAVVVKVGVGGVSDAFQALRRSEDEAGSAAERVEGALRQVEQARIRLRNIIDKEAPEQLAQARERAADAERAAANALLSSERALRNYNDAQEETADALEDLNRARDRARESIQQLRFEVEGAAISEKQARLSFERSRDALQRVQDLPPNSRARQEAELAFAQADLNLRRAIDRNSDLKREEDAATRAGVEGSDEVVRAKARIENAIIAEKDAQISAANAQIQVQKARAEAERAAAAAAEGGSVQRQVDAQIAAARESLQDAIRDLEQAQSQGGKAVSDAFEDISPAAEEFVRRLDSLEDSFKRIRFATQEGLFPGLTRSLDILAGRLDDLEPLFNNTGAVIGDVAENFTQNAFEGRNFSTLERVWRTNDVLIGNFGRSAANLYTVLLNILDAARPLAERFGAWIEKLTGRWAESTSENVDGLTERFNAAGDILARLGGIFSDVVRGFRGLGDAVEESGALEDFIGYMERGAKAFGDFAEAGGNDEVNLVKYFADVNRNVQAVLSALSEIVQQILLIGGDDSTGEFATAIEQAAKNFGDALRIVGEGENGLDDFILKLSEVFLLLAENESFGMFFGVLNDFLDLVKQFIETPFGQWFIDTVLPIFAMIKAVGLITRFLKFLGLATLGNVFKPFKMAGEGISNYRKAVKKAGSMTALVAQQFRKVSLLFDGPRLRLMYFKEWVAKQMPFVKAAFRRFGDAIRSVFTRLGNVFRTFLTDLRNAFKMIFDGLKNVITRVWTSVRTFAGRLLGWLGRTLTLLKGKILFALNAVKTAVIKALLALGKAMLAAAPWILLIVALVAIVVLIVKNWDKIKEVVRKAVEAVKEKIVEVWGKIREKTSEFLGKVKDFFTDLWDSIKRIFNRIKDWLVDNHPMAVLFRFVKDKWPEIKNWFTERIDLIVGFFSGIKDRISEKVSGMWDGLKDTFREALNWVIRKWNDFGFEIRIPGDVPVIGGKGISLSTPNIPLLAEGGIVPATPGGMLARIGEAGQAERVEPLDSDGLSQRDKAMIKFLTNTATGVGGPTINVYPAPGMNERELADLVSRRLASQMRSGGI